MIDDFQLLLTAAVRYCIGRRTYMPEAITRWIMEHCHGMLDKTTISVMTRDIITAPDLGDYCDFRTWAEFRGWLWREEHGEEMQDADRL